MVNYLFSSYKALRIDFGGIFRPLDANRERVRPAMLEGYCVSNNILGPCCLCPLKDRTKPAFVEASIELAEEGIFSGEYISKCAEDYCEYFGM